MELKDCIIRELTNDDLVCVHELWNKEIGFIFPFSVETLEKKTFKSKYILREGCLGCFINNALLGFIFIKKWDNNPVIIKYKNVGWISLLYVAKKSRNKGIGSVLLEEAEKVLKDNNVTYISVGADMDNFFPGVPCDFDNLTPPFFEKRGYNVGRYTHDLILPNLDKYVPFNNDIPFEIRFCESEDKSRILDFMKESFYGRWYLEVEDYFNSGEINKEYLIVLDKGKVIAFLRVNDKTIKNISYNTTWRDKFNNLAGIGPLGVSKEYRGLGIAKKMIDFALVDLQRRKIKEVIIDWTGIMSFYQQFGFEVWKCYTYIGLQIKD